MLTWYLATLEDPLGKIDIFSLSMYGLVYFFGTSYARLLSLCRVCPPPPPPLGSRSLCRRPRTETDPKGDQVTFGPPKPGTQTENSIVGRGRRRGSLPPPRSW